ncbi:MAG: 16S rRNA (adenine(1518)-N(6)/adenine(1519)-N(6))-dimethyltransferase RsmA [Leptospirales bacterium]|nr:16S rRNA (adenine(1518)-N(6)/adenine(1519)-N(6))-dimethyltransferase RsmA [Leptospirales bacterium]
MNKSEILEIIRTYGLAPNKKLGQNFLIDENIIQKIIDISQPEKKRILEIGPGLGAITYPLANKALLYSAVEIDSGFVRYLQDTFNSFESVNIIHGDFLKCNLEDKFDIIISNLPYNSASEILFRIAKDFNAKTIFIMLQKEMSERIMSLPGSKIYGALAVTLSYYFDSKILFHISGESFYPKPDVKSSFLQLTRKERYFKNRNHEDVFHLVVKSAFWGRRKTILKSLSESPHMELNRDRVKKILDLSEIQHNIRSEMLSLEDYIKLTEKIMVNG